MSIQPISFPQKGVSGMTGSWRLQKPVLDLQKCSNCLFCWIFCPEAVIDKATLAIDYTYCKGCGVCAQECPTGAMTMIEEDAQ